MNKLSQDMDIVYQKKLEYIARIRNYTISNRKGIRDHIIN